MVPTQVPWKVGHLYYLLFYVLLVLTNLHPTYSFNWSAPSSATSSTSTRSLSLEMLRCRTLSGVAARRSASLLTGSRVRPTRTTLDFAPTTSSVVPQSTFHRFSRMQLFSSVSAVTEPASTADDDIEETATAARTEGTPKPTSDSIEAELQALGIRSRPAGTWNVEDPVGWAHDFGSRSPSYKERLKGLIHLRPGDEGYFDVGNLRVPGVTMVRTKEQARIVLEKLNQADPAIFHACDTEVMDIDLKSVGPIGNGYVTCASIYSGPTFDYGLGEEPGSSLWIDNLDDACSILQEFKDWFENERFLKVWHNYGFDRHVMWNEGINVLGVGGDTMHMARLQDSSRSRLGQGNGYGLEALTNDLVQRRKEPMKEIFGIRRLRKDG
jgi:hypothetical protein